MVRTLGARPWPPPELDTGQEDGQMAARTLIEVSGWERERLSERTQKGLEAARWEAAFNDGPSPTTPSSATGSPPCERQG